MILHRATTWTMGDSTDDLHMMEVKGWEISCFQYVTCNSTVPAQYIHGSISEHTEQPLVICAVREGAGIAQ